MKGIMLRVLGLELQVNRLNEELKHRDAENGRLQQQISELRQGILDHTNATLIDNDHVAEQDAHIEALQNTVPKRPTHIASKT